ncbi:MAG: glycosyltransferase family 2 protein, partial [Moorea sp. SIO3I7]|nr:glycosyltransferase family 2 protein [Moorena sp. SIO3I7]
GTLLGIRWLILYFAGTPKAHVPSLVLAAILILMGFQLWIFGLVADLMAVNRQLLEDIQLRLRRLEVDSNRTPNLRSTGNQQQRENREEGGEGEEFANSFLNR